MSSQYQLGLSTKNLIWICELHCTVRRLWPAPECSKVFTHEERHLQDDIVDWIFFLLLGIVEVIFRMAGPYGWRGRISGRSLQTQKVTALAGVPSSGPLYVIWRLVGRVPRDERGDTNFTSSAKRTTFPVTRSGRSLMYSRTRSCPRIGPWGTPLSAAVTYERHPLTEHRNDLFLRKAAIQVTILP